MTPVIVLRDTLNLEREESPRSDRVNSVYHHAVCGAPGDTFYLIPRTSDPVNSVFILMPCLVTLVIVLSTTLDLERKKSPLKTRLIISVFRDSV